MIEPETSRDPRNLTTRLNILADDLLNWSWRRTLPIADVQIAELAGAPQYGELAPPAEAAFAPARLPFAWSGTNRYAWLRFTVATPDWPAADGPMFLRGNLSQHRQGSRSPQGIVLIDGRPCGGIDRVHRVVRLADRPEPGRTFEVLLLAWTGMEANCGQAQPFELAQLNTAVEQFALDMKTAAQTAELLDREDYRRYRLLEACDAAARRLDLSKPIGEGFRRSVPPAHAALREAIAKIELPADRPVASMVGHGHLDLGWLWPVEASHLKALHTVINQLAISDELGEHVFLWSQPQSWKWIRHDHPATWERIRGKIRSGVWEASGAMWVEADTNITGGESLVRQMLYGTRFLREHVGEEETLLWLPDVFGYSAALPQLLRQFGIEYFMTTKISWNEFNEFPWETFFWEGLDGSRVLTHFGACRYEGSYITYNVLLGPRALFEGWRDYRAKHITNRFLVSFGHGDGGGGPTRQEVQFGQRVGRMPGLPAAKFQRPRQFFAELAAEADRSPGRFPTWVGELYLEFHRGTYTTEGRTKRGNRLCENMLHDAELLAALAMPLGGGWDKPAFDACWEKLLLNQFHDILPGSSIQMVYDQAEKDYQWILGRAGELRDRAATQIAARIDTAAARPVVLFNTLDSHRTDPVELPAAMCGGDVALKFPDGRAVPTQAASDPDGRAYRIAGNCGVPPIGWVAADVVDSPPPPVEAEAALVAKRDLLENARWRIELDAAGRITRLLDRKANREVLAPGQSGNQLQLFRDRPTSCTAWNIDYNDLQRPLAVLEAERAEVVERGPVRAAVRCRYRFGRSTLVQDIRIHRGIERIDFATWVDWHEQDLLLKAAFPVAVASAEATYEIQFGSVRRPTHRNTSWDMARFEVPAQRWVDLGEWGYGVSLLNDCKYGHDVLADTMRISLLRGPARAHDGTYADQGEHRFTYSLLPHAGDWRERTISAAAELNTPLLAVPAEAHAGELPATWSFVQAEPTGFVLATIKKAEDDDRLILRGYESCGGRGRVTLRFGGPVRSAWRSRADERTEEPLKVADDAVAFDVRPFEVVTLKVQPGGRSAGRDSVTGLSAGRSRKASGTSRGRTGSGRRRGRS